MISITITGRIGKDAETRAAGKDTVTSFSVAADQRKGSEKTTSWFDCSVWSKRGSALQPYLKKGQSVTVIGELTQREHNGKTYLGIRVEHIELQGGGKGGATSNSGGNSRSNDLPSDEPASGFGGNDGSDDIPF